MSKVYLLSHLSVHLIRKLEKKRSLFDNSLEMKEDIEDDVNNTFYYCPFIVKLQQVIAVTSRIKRNSYRLRNTSLQHNQFIITVTLQNDNM